MENKFTWGDSVIIQDNAPSLLHIGEIASVCGFYKVISEEAANIFNCSLGDWIYTVEFGNGCDIQIAEIFLKKYDGN